MSFYLCYLFYTKENRSVLTSLSAKLNQYEREKKKS